MTIRAFKIVTCRLVAQLQVEAGIVVVMERLVTER